MGSATREARARSVSALAGLGSKADLATAEDLFAAGRVVADSVQLRAVLSDPAADRSGKDVLVKRVFGALSAPAVELLGVIAGERWSGQDDVLDAIEELGIRSIAASAPRTVDIPAELLAFGGAVTSDAELELALRSKLADPSAKAALVERLLVGKAAGQTVAITRQLVLQPRGRSVRQALREAARIVAAQDGQTIATVVTATPLPAAQAERLRASLAAKYGDLKLNQVVDPSILGGMRVQIGGDVIDGSVSSRLSKLRLQLAG
ncbi:ATP synthase F0F1 subunit delta [Leifsonia xyli subsp. xyli]|uniref:ATP synthase subunit delta n=2 Tax=Leifsonia xyli subsp. xyli TaxID=59736 RepID=ATPD_LEIXX|nr:F0F1 ATP synthase subunit delta [Leifsonia xyli]Q6AG61.1 RecName: Full=ATP synthase subunit delta; AltName: Full=ATP synthase F(1) sector subunit delta; AltName: Full=F-type ATPase subunit delta; Short=F-ATPase subunit delta [Leifsonia xyli subsp. xyli str. CTCB07]AAT88634.1 ATP synthetase, delta chain [Leifsonia xyli subsp. xyli str. CTCB07]ODA90786.1 ATP synthase F0F1 subunit delta [Leifsonia xyli subsp. xyli]